MFKNLIFGIALMATTSAYSGQDGNGGFGLKCGSKYELLDLYEAREIHGYTVDLGPANLSVDQKVEIMLKRLEKTNPVMANDYRKQYAEMDIISGFLDGKIVINNDQLILDNKIIPKLDIGETIIPENCTFVPFARNISFQNKAIKKKIFFYKKYWDLLDNNNRTALVLHELFYWNQFQGRSGINVNSGNVRSLVALLSSRTLENLNSSEAIQLLQETSALVSLEVNGFKIRHEWVTENERYVPKIPKMENSDDGFFIKKLVFAKLANPRYDYRAERSFNCKNIILKGQKICVKIPTNALPEDSYLQTFVNPPQSIKHVEFFNADTPNFFIPSNGRNLFQLSTSIGKAIVDFDGNVLSDDKDNKLLISPFGCSFIKLRSQTELESINYAEIKIENENFTAQIFARYSQIYFNEDQTIPQLAGDISWIFKNGLKFKSERNVYLNYGKVGQLESLTFSRSNFIWLEELLKTGPYTYKGKKFGSYPFLNASLIELYPSGQIKSVLIRLRKKDKFQTFHFDINGKVVRVE